MTMLRTRSRDFNAYLSEMDGLCVQLLQGDITDKEYDSKLTLLKEKYKKKIHKEDIRTFKSSSEFSTFVKEHPLLDSDAFTHEHAHGEKAEEMGYEVEYGIAYLIGDVEKGEGPIGLMPFVNIETKKPEKGEIIKIIEAPEELGPHDKAFLKALKKEKKKSKRI